MCCLQYNVDAEFTKDERESSSQAIRNAKAFCQPLLSGETTALNGKKVKPAYLVLRPELQHIRRLAKAKLSVDGMDKDPIVLARKINEELMNVPVQVVVFWYLPGDPQTYCFRVMVLFL